MESRVYPCRFYPYLRVNVNTLALFPISSPPPTPPECTAPSIPRGNVRQETVSALLQNLRGDLPSQHVAELETVQQLHACTERAHAHGRYSDSEIIDADGAAADRGGGTGRSKGQISSAWRKPWKRICWKKDHVCPEPKHEQLLCPVFFIILCMLETSNIFISETTSACK